MVRGAKVSPAEALVLLEPHGSKASTALKVTLLSLLAQGYLRAEEVSGQRRIWCLRVARSDPPPAAEEASLFALVQAAQAEDRGTIAFIVGRARETYGNDFTALKRDFIFPSLKRRGLMTERRHQVLGIPRTTFDPTPAGKAIRDDIRTKIERARKLPEMLNTDPRQAVAIAHAIGGVMLLVPELVAFHQRISEAMRTSPSQDGLGLALDLSPGTASDSDDLAAVDTSALDAFEGAVAAFNAGVDAPAGGDGGGDGD